MDKDKIDIKEQNKDTKSKSKKNKYLVRYIMTLKIPNSNLASSKYKNKLAQVCFHHI